jgi:uncharacterized paraquat-inducible protein A
LLDPGRDNWPVSFCVPNANTFLMGFFNDLGRKAEKLKQEATAASRAEATHACTDCETLLYTAHSECPDCGGDVVPLADE